ncbi:MAG TPA: TetR/AcrR family transcriptional regulator, partial [Jatrophihabitans sp.]|nr:TetR/AcrR family transcriptional regulator [Jatrophihabitans sp.]
AVAEVVAVGAAGVSMREIARRAGVSHAAPAHHFGDKTGIFTAIATEGFHLTAEAIGPAATGPFGFLHGGAAYVGSPSPTPATSRSCIDLACTAPATPNWSRPAMPHSPSSTTAPPPWPPAGTSTTCPG